MNATYYAQLCFFSNDAHMCCSGTVSRATMYTQTHCLHALRTDWLQRMLAFGIPFGSVADSVHSDVLLYSTVRSMATLILLGIWSVCFVDSVHLILSSEPYRQRQTPRQYYEEHRNQFLTENVMTKIGETCHATIVVAACDASEKPKISV